MISLRRQNKSARFTATYEFQRDEEASNSLSSTSKSLQRGLVGFHWVAVKFRIRELRICGIMDKEAAVAKLRKMLDQPKGAPVATGEGDSEEEGADDGEGEDEGEDEPPENPTAPDDGGEKKSKPIDDI